MKRSITLVIVLATLVGSALAQIDPDATQRAVGGLTHLRSMMKDPNSFVLEGAYLLKPDKHGKSEICYRYTAHNSFGGYGGTSEAILLKNDKVFLVDDEMMNNPFFGLTDSCRPKNRVADITADVQSTVDPSQTKSAQILSPADRPKMVAAENASFKKEGVAGYAEVVDDTYIVHSERASSIRFHANMLADKDYMGALRRSGITTLVYTNDAELKFVYDLKADQIVQPSHAAAR